jgi:hypothetical protein
MHHRAILACFSHQVVAATALVAWAQVSPDLPQSSDAMNPDALRRHVEFLAGMNPPRTGSMPLARAADYVESEFRNGRGRVSRQGFQVDGEIYYNVVAEFGPGEGEKIVVGAHYDSAYGNPGADDNASGVATLIELARLLDGTAFRTRVELVSFALEEAPYFRSPQMGSAVHARNSAQNGEEVTLMLCLEMVGFFSDDAGSQDYPARALGLFYPDRGDFIAVVGRVRDFFTVRRIKRLISAASSVPVRSLGAPAFVPGIDFSDHLNYWKEGFSAVMITDTAFYRNGNYHTEQDLPDTLDYEGMASVGQGVLHAIRELAR